MNKFHSRLLFALISLVIIVLVGLGILLGQMFKSFYLNSFNDRMEKEADIVALYVNEHSGTIEGLQSKIEALGESLKLRITIITQEGSLFLDSGTNSGKSNELNQRIIDQVIKKQISSTTDLHVIDEEYDMFYYGIPLVEDSTVNGYVILSSSVDSLRKVYQQIWLLIISSLVLALIVIIVVGTKIATQYTKPIESATKVAIELTKGNYRARSYEDQSDETGYLSQSLNILARNLQDVTKAHEMEKDRLRTLIENMGSGLILINERGYIELVNRAYKEIFEVSGEEYLSRLYYDAVEYQEIVSLIEEVFMTEKKVRKQILLSFSIERKHFEVYGAPIIGTHDEWKGVLLVFHDITELKKLEQTRKDFVANVSHELKTPVTSIKGFSETLLDGAMKDEETLEYFLKIILKETDRLQTLIEELLDLSKIEKQGFKLNIQKIKIKDLLHDINAMLKGNAENKQIELLLHYPRNDIFIDGDINRLKQVFINIINNSIHYTPAGGCVRIEVIDELENVAIRVHDTGIGIAEKEIPRVFERFYRVDKARSRNSGGTGLGLAIVKHIVEAHHGTISLKSKLGEGTSVSVVLKKRL